jgi:predicted cobalt transporter CbtA
MTTDHLEQGALAGVAGGLVYGLFLATVGNSFIAGLESFESGHHESAAVVSELTTAAASVGGGVLWGLLFGVGVFGVAYYLFEPALPGGTVGKRVALAAAGFLVVSGAPWLVLPPQPPGVEQALSTETRLLWYGGMMAVGALVVGLCGVAYQRAADRHRAVTAGATVAPLALLAIPVALAPANPVHGPVPDLLAAAYRWTIVFGQALLWATIASVHAWLGTPDLATEASEFPAPSD